LTSRYDPDNAEHRKIKKEIEEGDGLPDMATTTECGAALKKAGFQVIETRDAVNDPYPGGDVWYEPLSPSWYPLSQRFQFNPVGEALVTASLKVLEGVRLAPKGTSKVQRMLMNAQKGLVAGGQKKIFTPMYMMVGRKPN
jgi:sterol 24-C-methyltransferase